MCFGKGCTAPIKPNIAPTKIPCTTDTDVGCNGGGSGDEASKAEGEEVWVTQVELLERPVGRAALAAFVRRWQAEERLPVPGSVGLIAGGPPCQDVSLLGVCDVTVVAKGFLMVHHDERGPLRGERHLEGVHQPHPRSAVKCYTLMLTSIADDESGPDQSVRQKKMERRQERVQRRSL